MKILTSVSVVLLGLIIAFQGPGILAGEAGKDEAAAGGSQPPAPVEKAEPELPPEPKFDAPPKPETPRDGEVRLPAAEGWRATLLLDNAPTGVWTVKSYQVFPQFGCPEVVGLDDKGRCHVLVSYSGRWTPYRVIDAGKWLGGLAHGDVDPRVKGAELYAGGKQGNVFQVRSYKESLLDARRIARIYGREIHTILAGEIDPSNDTRELIIFTRPGGLYRLTPTGKDGEWETELIEDLEGRFRDAVLMPSEPGKSPEIACVARTGHLKLLRLTKDGPSWRTIYEAEMGMGRIALRPPKAGRQPVLYTTHDDGRILRHERSGPGADWRTEEIFLGPLGPRGIGAGQFNEDPDVETVACFGYSGKVQVLTKQNDRWTAETLFVDRDKGHWLTVAEVDGRNNTREIIVSGYGARIVMLYRPPGYGRKVTADTED
jgi:hypothetical protein